jgi:hypothetical protein
MAPFTRCLGSALEAPRQRGEVQGIVDPEATAPGPRSECVMAAVAGRVR